ncbi:zinc ribbon domain-containing protein [Ktedonospora formicarum]|uniref:DZANK-type domain-containing protein n=1 Tax=Ktedonospora formicarum TaxID=2778364 RepID=A0A8J3I2P5_9CHLR|nr:zinc ribbon domain-containing protein [Ktedonospora formicarum]GHO45608.1 hypothetical protein KSX_37710 [Ktedonospora formicarum]
MTCVSCGADVTGKKFCPECGTSVQAARTVHRCPHCQSEVRPGVAFCGSCGQSLRGATPPPPPATRGCPSCHAELPLSSAFCTNCGYQVQASTSASASGQYAQYPSQPQTAYPASQPYQQPSQYPQPYGQQGFGGGYQPDPMLGQGQMALRCPTCMAMAPVGTTNCRSCRTSLVGVVPMPMNAMYPGQPQQQGGFLQGDGGKYALGALGGAAAVIGGEMLLDNLRDGGHHHRHRDDDDGGPLEFLDDIGLF